MNFRSRILVTSFTVIATAAAFACANPNAPPGGPIDIAPPVIMRITPATGTINAKPKSVAFQFNEVVSETPKGAQNLASLVFISPKSGDPEVSWHRSQLDVKPRKGWKPNTVYSVTLSAGIMDLHNNSIDSATRLVFSTGGPIPSTRIDGAVFDWANGRPARNAIVEAIAPGRDSVTYQTIADTAGRYLLEHLPVGPYTMRAYIDRNTSRSLEPTEQWDSVGLTVTNMSNADFYAFQHDTVGERIADIFVTDSNTRLKVTFDKPLAPAQTYSAAQFVLQKADSSTLNIETVFSGPQRATLDSLRQKARDDSVARAQPPLDMSPAARARRDSVARLRLRDSLNFAERRAREAKRLATVRGAKPLAPHDTTPPPKMKRPVLFNELYITLQRPLEPNTNYRLTVRTIRSVSGTVKSPTRAFRTAPKEVPKDSAKTNRGRDTLELFPAAANRR